MSTLAVGSILSAFTPAVITMAALVIGAYLLTVFEHCLAWGSLRQARAAFVAPLADVVALLRQADTPPEHPDGFLFRSAPIVALATVGLAALVIPVGRGATGLDSSIGLFYFIVLLSPFVIAMMNAGWSSNSKVGLFGTFRAAAHLISYEVPLGFAAIGAPMAAQSLAIGRIVEAQSSLWFGVWQPLGVVIYLIASFFVCFRHPFDAPQASSELEGGIFAEYTGPRLLIFTFALKAIFLVLMAMAVALFFGGWQGPVLPGPVWFALKTFLLAMVVIALSRFVPRLRSDQMLTLSWKALVPASLLNIVVVGVLTILIYGVK
ncbi:MAG: NADH-quinone oxidoreductase subunit H [Ktedonobacterales bacterium]|nr:NADH-quinone oxidoreductase subunit H [Ktedonobacterales bacterium]